MILNLKKFNQLIRYKKFKMESSNSVQSPNVHQSAAGIEHALKKEISELGEKEASLDMEISQLEAEGYSLEELDQHIKLLHEYNELKDTGQMLLGRLAVLQGVTTKELYSEFGMELED
ncbi:DNA repair protein SWI5 homolog [Gastrophryne carolinensis]